MSSKHDTMRRKKKANAASYELLPGLTFPAAEPELRPMTYLSDADVDEYCEHADPTLALLARNLRAARRELQVQTNRANAQFRRRSR